jgi:hypothetical protein
MTLREYIEELGFDDYEYFFETELTSLVLMPIGRIIPAQHYSSFLDYDIEEIEYHVELERGSTSKDDKCSSYHIITLYPKESA